MNDALLTWYWQNKRDLPWRKSKHSYPIWVSEIMLQQTQVNTVIPYYERFLEYFPTIEALAQATEDEVLSLWKGLGYYSRARNLWRGAKYVMDQLGGVVPQDYITLRKIPGVGEYTAGAIASIAFGVKVSAIDGNVKRVVSRILGWREPVDSAKSRKTFLAKIEQWQPEEYPGDFNQALMELGAMICTPKSPKCENCPVAQTCEAYRFDDVLNFPVKRQKSEPKMVTRLIFVLRKEGQVYLQQRPNKGLLARLWEFPGVEIEIGGVGGEVEWGKLRELSSEQWFNYYKKSVQDRTYDQWVERKIRQSFKLSGPLWYTFSHRRWKIYWALIELNELNNVDERLQMGMVLNEKISGYSGFERSPVQELNEAHWVNLKDLDKETIPVAFKEIVEKLLMTKH